MFQIIEFTEAKLTSVTNRVEKHGDEEVPAVSLGIELTTANTILDDIDPGLRHALYKAVEAQDQLPGVEPATPVLRTNVIDKVALTTAHEGWRLFVDDGIDDTKPMAFGGVKVDKLTIDAKQGGSVVLKLRLGTSDVDAEKLGKIGMHNGQSIWVQLLKPEKAEEVIDGSTEAFQRDHPGQGSLLDAEAMTPEKALAATSSGTNGPDGETIAPIPGTEGGVPETGSGPDAAASQASKERLDASGNNPFGRSEPGDGDDDSEGGHPDAAGAEFEAGAASAIAKARGAKVKYRNPVTGDTWSGRGLKPRWLVAELAAGKTLGEFVA